MLHLRYLFRKTSHRQYLLFYLFPLYLSLSALWSPNPLRAVLTSGIFWCLIISAVGVLFNLKNQPTFRKELLGRTFLFSAILISLFCWLQCYLDVFLQFPLQTFEVPRSLTFLCPGCTSRVLGFPRPSGFAIEPQFMDNLLLAPTFYSFYLYFARNNFTSHKQKLVSALLPTFLLTTFFLVFSRGAIYSFGVGFLVFLILSWRQSQLSARKIIGSFAICFLSLALCLSAQCFFARSDKTPRSAKCTLSTSLAQLTLDAINFDCRTDEQKDLAENQDYGIKSYVSATEANRPQDHAETAPSDVVAREPVFTGYVAESTDTRLKLSRLALESSTASAKNFLFGYGLGSAGTTLYNQGKTDSTKEIVQNEYLSLLLETGLLGLFLLILSLVLLIKLFLSSRRSQNTSQSAPNAFDRSQLFLSSLCLSFSLTLLFFSGLPNALHLYLFPVFLYLILGDSSKVPSKTLASTTQAKSSKRLENFASSRTRVDHKSNN